MWSLNQAALERTMGREGSDLGSLISQADAVLPSHSWQVLPAVQRHENGPRAPRTPFCDREAERKRAGLRRIRHLQRRAGEAAAVLNPLFHCMMTL